jgi:hypothetical protein
MSDFLSREADILGGGFSSSGEIDFDRAAAAFPDISIDGSDDFHTPAPSQAASLARQDSNAGFSFDAFDDPPAMRATDVKVTGDDEIDKFESEFPDIGVSQVGKHSVRQLLVDELVFHCMIFVLGIRE